MAAAAAAVDAGDAATAEPLLVRIVAENPRDADAWHMLAVFACRGGRATDAIELATRALELQRRNGAYLNTLGIAYGETQQFEQALRCFKRALKERPDYADAHYNLGKIYWKLGDLSEAKQCYLRARRLDPGKAEVANNLAILYMREGRWQEALALLHEARAGRPDHEAMAINMAIACLATMDGEASIRELTSFIERHPSAAAVHAQLGRHLLAEGRFAQGWHEYGWRHGRAPDEYPNCEGKRVLLLPDQGLGDHLFFLRFASALRARSAHVALACPEQLFTLLEGQSPVDELRRKGDSQAGFDFAMPLGDLPRVLGTEDTPAPFAISVAPHRLAEWRGRLTALGPPPYLGVTWRGGTAPNKRSEFAARGEQPLYKEIAIPMLASLARRWTGTVLILQRLPRAGEISEFCNRLGRDAHDLSAVNEDLADMAALLSLIDEYVGVSNANMHIRGGVGKAARVLLPFPPEFRWMHSGNRSPWFPMSRIYRQAPTLDWTKTLRDLSDELTGPAH